MVLYLDKERGDAKWAKAGWCNKPQTDQREGDRSSSSVWKSEKATQSLLLMNMQCYANVAFMEYLIILRSKALGSLHAAIRTSNSAFEGSAAKGDHLWPQSQNIIPSEQADIFTDQVRRSMCTVSWTFRSSSCSAGHETQNHLLPRDEQGTWQNPHLQLCPAPQSECRIHNTTVLLLFSDGLKLWKC